MSIEPNTEPKREKPEELSVSTQDRKRFYRWQPAWIKQLPRWRFDTAPDPNYQLIDKNKLAAVLAKVDKEAAKHIEDDIAFLDKELLRLFRERDYEASLHQNRYRRLQIGFMGLAAIATVLGGLQGIFLSGSPDLVPKLALAETIIALTTIFLATISGRIPSLPLWLQNRRRAETMRREYFRYLMRTKPYDIDTMEDYERKLLLSTRAANINRGIYPD